ncbi:hypothetical protein AMATHDRAFT_70840 [Amanita thiersii Skay4041]|uniref:Uncharacterized protein n=1 Tax=Amanita thiersii Skay4041 TaxID=703135 RepID=A0A2A9NCH2_9AGAR|nr:hypothetical protein AMATHDRAFT_70840 [Amanita thiersii Skay4041]
MAINHETPLLLHKREVRDKLTQLRIDEDFCMDKVYVWKLGDMLPAMTCKQQGGTAIQLSNVEGTQTNNPGPCLVIFDESDNKLKNVKDRGGGTCYTNKPPSKSKVLCNSNGVPKLDDRGWYTYVHYEGTMKILDYTKFYDGRSCHTGNIGTRIREALRIP